MKKLILIGGGGHCKSCIDVIESEGKFKVSSILDIEEKLGQDVLGYPIVGSDKDIEKFVRKNFYFIITLGQIKTADLRIKIFNQLKGLDAKLATIISPLAYVSKYAEVSEGTIVLHDALINANAKIGKNCIINTKALVEHDAIISNHCHISIGATIGGNAVIEEQTFIGAGSVVVNNTTVTQKSFVKANSLQGNNK